MKSYKIPEAGRTSRGTALVNLLQLGPDEHVTATMSVSNYDDSNEYLLLATKKGMVKKTPISEYKNVRKNGLIAITLREDDQLIEAKLINNEDDIMLGTKNAMAICFHSTDVRLTGRSSMGVKGITLGADDEVIGMQKLSQGSFVLVVSEKGMGKLTDVNSFKVQKRGGRGLICYKTTDKTGKLVSFKITNKDRDLLLITNDGTVMRMSLRDAKDIGRNTSGVKFMNIDPASDTVIASVAKVREAEKEAEESTKAPDSDLDETAKTSIITTEEENDEKNE